MEMNYDDKEIRQIEAELHTEILPGTEIMADVGTHHFVKGAGKTVLVPQPSDDPHDPLNWSTGWKIACITASTVVTFTQGFGPLALAPMFEPIMEDFHCSLADAVQFTGVCILVLGFSNFIWVPISTSFGRRPVYLLSQLINFGTSIWRAKATSYGSFMGACVVNGIGAGPAETMQPAVIADIFFLHDRGKWNTLYWVTYMGSLMVGPIISGPMASNVGWRTFWWLNTALLGFSFLLVVFMFPETKYHRPHPDELNHTISKGSPAASSNEKLETAITTENTASKPTDPESIQQVPTSDCITGPLAGLTQEETAALDPYLGKGKPGKYQWRVFQPNAHPFKTILLDLWIPWKMFAFPIVEFASFVVSWSCSSFLTLNLTQSQAFAAPPYNFKPQTIVGFFNFAILVGALIGLFTAGPLSDWISARSTRRNNGIREPEMRLPAMIPYVIIMYLGNIIVAVGYQRHWPWEAIVIIGFTCAGIQVAALPSISSTYAVDSYKPVAGSLFVSITVNKNVWGYGFSKFITVWAEDDGFIPPIMTNGSLILLWCLFGILFWWKGKTFRRWTKNSKVHRM
ncbi:MFS transporter-like protein [Lindgomyces ingoldianus]|uniref:MFS transporter-like protein n=1 Tax=Lindgomyces ingoldianus TaxID=673940 RepID=A0ACB6QH02_9PLEO|nr:MFS transporter-like protein [Lindgomyces ingoldianus]KAF2465642.1 MFS transporter-like protein [Lindgomyces ingoldianus]